MAEMMNQRFKVGDVVTWVETGQIWGGRITGWTQNGRKAILCDNNGDPHAVPAHELVPNLLPRDDDDPPGGGAETRSVYLCQIVPSRWQPRAPAFDEDELVGLMRSIMSTGLFNPITVFEVEDGYELVAGERRVRASAAIALGDTYPKLSHEDYCRRLAGVGLQGLNRTERQALGDSGATIRANVEPADLDRLHLIAVMENIQRQNLTPIEEARGFLDLTDTYGWTQRELAEKIGRSQGYVAQRMNLLTLPAAAQDAVNTRVLTISHARALGAVPEPMQDAVTTWAVAQVQADDAPATTREIEDRTRKVAQFVDVTRWRPTPGAPYPPERRNRLAMMVWMLEQADLSTRADEILALGEASNYSMLDRSPQEVAAGATWMMDRLSRALMDRPYDDAYRAFAAATDRRCATCVINTLDVSDIPTSQHETLGTHCPRWSGAERSVCPRWIGPDDPVVMVLNYALRRRLDDLGIDYAIESWGWRMDDLGAYVKALRLAAAQDDDIQVEVTVLALARARKKIMRFRAWASARSAVELQHFQAHHCTRCKHNVTGDDGQRVCQFYHDPMVSDYSGEPRAPEFGVLVAEDGRLYPRCEGYIMRTAPMASLRGDDDDSMVLKREHVLRWMKLMREGRSSQSNYVLWGPLQWLDYGHAPGEESRRQLRNWLTSHWDELGPGGVATLLDTYMHDVLARDVYARGSTIDMYNPIDGQVETYVPLAFEYLTGSEWGHWQSWPANWPQPWDNPENLMLEDEGVNGESDGNI